MPDAADARRTHPRAPIIQALLLAASLLAAVGPSTAAARTADPHRDQPGKGGDAVLPAGYQGALWGIAPVPLQAVRGRALEEQLTPDPHVRLLIEVPQPDSEDGAGDGRPRADGVVKWKFWDERLIEIHLFYSPELTTQDGIDLVARFEEKYGGGRHEVIRPETAGSGSRGPLAAPLEERWVWQDPFTVQILRRDVKTGQWSCFRQSRVLEASRIVQDEKEREQVRSQKVKSIQLD